MCVHDGERSCCCLPVVVVVVVVVVALSITDYVDFKMTIDDYSLLPFCDLSIDSNDSMKVLEHLEVKM